MGPTAGRYEVWQKFYWVRHEDAGLVEGSAEVIAWEGVQTERLSVVLTDASWA